jgi:hypothetical protein
MTSTAAFYRFLTFVILGVVGRDSSCGQGKVFAYQADDLKQLRQRQAAREGEMVDARFGGIEHIEIDMKIRFAISERLNDRVTRGSRCTGRS